MANEEVEQLRAELTAAKKELEETRAGLACALTGAAKGGHNPFDEADVDVLHTMLRFAHERGDTEAAMSVAEGACCTPSRARHGVRHHDDDPI